MESKRFFFLAHLSYVGGETSTFFGRFTLKKNMEMIPKLTICAI